MTRFFGSPVGLNQRFPVAADGTWGGDFTVPAGTAPGEYELTAVCQGLPADDPHQFEYPPITFTVTSGNEPPPSTTSTTSGRNPPPDDTTTTTTPQTTTTTTTTTTTPQTTTTTTPSQTTTTTTPTQSTTTTTPSQTTTTTLFPPGGRAPSPAEIQAFVERVLELVRQLIASIFGQLPPGLFVAS